MIWIDCLQRGARHEECLIYVGQAVVGGDDLAVLTGIYAGEGSRGCFCGNGGEFDAFEEVLDTAFVVGDVVRVVGGAVFEFAFDEMGGEALEKVFEVGGVVRATKFVDEAGEFFPGGEVVGGEGVVELIGGILAEGGDGLFGLRFMFADLAIGCFQVVFGEFDGGRFDRGGFWVGGQVEGFIFDRGTVLLVFTQADTRFVGLEAGAVLFALLADDFCAGEAGDVVFAWFGAV